MRLLVPIVVLLVTAWLLPRPGKEGTDVANYEQAVLHKVDTDATKLTKEVIDLDAAVEAAGMLNRLDLLNF